MSDIEILPMGPHEFSVTVAEGDIRTTHRVTVPDDIRDVLVGADEPAVVRESIEVLLERKVVTELAPAPAPARSLRRAGPPHAW